MVIWCCGKRACQTGAQGLQFGRRQVEATAGGRSRFGPDTGQFFLSMQRWIGNRPQPLLGRLTRFHEGVQTWVLVRHVAFALPQVSVNGTFD